MDPRWRIRGVKRCTFKCEIADAFLCVRVLWQHKEVVKASITHFGGQMEYTIDLDDRDELQCAELKIRRALELVVARHRLPSDPPPAAA